MINTRTKVFKSREDIVNYIRRNYGSNLTSSSKYGWAYMTETTVYAYITEKRKDGWHTTIFSFDKTLLNALNVKVQQERYSFNRKGIMDKLHNLKESLKLKMY